MFADDVLKMDREASVSGNALEEDLIRALIATGFMDGGPFLNLYMGTRQGIYQKNSDWIVETDVDGDDNPKLVWFQTPEIYFDLNRHLQTVHGLGTTHVCDTCGKFFESPAKLKNHIRVIHEGHEDHKCDQCFQTFAEARTLKTHIKFT